MGSKKPSLFHKIKSNVSLFNEFDILIYEGIPQNVGVSTAVTLAEDAVISALDCRINYNSVSKELAVTASEPVHNLHQIWIKRELGRGLLSGFLLVSEWNAIDCSTRKSESHVPSPTATDHAMLPGFSTFMAPYQSSWRQPEFCLKPRHRVLPTLVVESGWAEFYPSLLRNKDLWLIGGWPHVNVVFLIEWSRSPRSRIRGRLEVYRRQTGSVQVEVLSLFQLSASQSYCKDHFVKFSIVLILHGVAGDLPRAWPGSGPADGAPHEGRTLRHREIPTFRSARDSFLT